MDCRCIWPRFHYSDVYRRALARRLRDYAVPEDAWHSAIHFKSLFLDNRFPQLRGTVPGVCKSQVYNAFALDLDVEVTDATGESEMETKGNGNIE